MYREYHRLLSNSTVVEALFCLERELASECRLKGCPHCGGELDRADYCRRPRGLSVALSRGQRRRISFCCRRCRRRTLPESVVFVYSKVYLFLPVLLTLSLCQGFPSELSMRRCCALCGVSEPTVRRWREWLLKFRESREWKLLRLRVTPLLEIQRFPQSLLEEFLKRSSDLITATIQTLRFLTLLSQYRPCNLL